MAVYLILAGVPLYLAAYQDTRKGIVYDRWWILMVLCAVAGTFMGYQTPFRLIYGFVVMGMPLLMYAVLDGGNGMGGGDVKICASIGAVVGMLSGYLIFLIALLFFLFFMLFTGKKHGPFVPSLFIAYIIYIIIRSIIYDL